jgi:predicted nucleotidyltransferase
MKTRSRIRRKNPVTGLYYPNLVPMSAIRRFVREVVEKFHPQTVILFGSYAYGNPTRDSDVDLLVVMPARNEIHQAGKIDEATEAPFFLDLIVRTPHNLKRRLQWGDWFLREVVSQGKVLHDEADRRVDQKSRRRSRRRRSAA